MRKLRLFYLGLVVSLLSSGCASVRVKTDLLPETDVKLKSPAGLFYIAKLKYDCDEGGPVSTGGQSIDATYERKLLKLVKKECATRYPLIFSEEDKSALPLFVRITDVMNENRVKTAIWLGCSLTIFGGVLPGPVEYDRDLAVSASIWNGTDCQGSAAVRKNFRREERGWMTVFTPLGLIPIPGESDFPKGSEAIGNGRQLVDDTQQIAQQVATALAKMIISKEPDFWTAPPRLSQPSGYTPTTPVITPSILPPPSEPVVPF